MAPKRGGVKLIFSQFSILATKKEHCNKINNTIIVNMLPRQEKKFFKFKYSVKRL